VIAHMNVLQATEETVAMRGYADVPRFARPGGSRDSSRSAIESEVAASANRIVGTGRVQPGSTADAPVPRLTR
jgi:hypothetical protein